MHIVPRPNNSNYKTLNYWIMLDRSVSTDDNFKITLFSGTEKEVEIDGLTITDTLDHDYGSYLVYKCENHTDFIHEWNRYVNIHQHDFERMYTALYSEYNPIENYDKNSTITNNGSTGANPENPFVTRTYQVADDTVNNNGDSAYIPQNKVATEGKTDTSNTMTEHTHGNIGVTKSSDMVRDEVALRTQYNLVETICRMYAEMELI